MTYISCAFETEARALIDFYKLDKRSDLSYKLFFNENILLIISGMGQNKAKEAIEFLLLNYPNKQDDIFLNLGVCAGQKKFEVGDLVQIKQLHSIDESHKLSSINKGIAEVSCFSSEVAVSGSCSQDIAEMEANSIYSIIQKYFLVKNISFLKIVSDNFNPIKFSKEFIINLTKQNIKEITKHINLLQEKNSEK